MNDKNSFITTYSCKAYIHTRQ